MTPQQVQNSSWLELEAEGGSQAAPNARAVATSAPTRDLRKACPIQPSWFILTAGVAVVVSGLVAIAFVARALYRMSAPAAAAQDASLAFLLHVSFSVFNFAGYRVALMAYNGSVPGPILSVSPGAIVSLTVVNMLPPNREYPGITNWSCWHPPPSWVPLARSSNASYGGRPVTGGHQSSDTAASPADYVNSPHAFRTTNLHTHGLQVSLLIAASLGCWRTPPTCYRHSLLSPQVSPDEDNLFLLAAPGETLQIQLHIPEDHPEGLFWYHPHAHGAAAVQVCAASEHVSRANRGRSWT